MTGGVNKKISTTSSCINHSFTFIFEMQAKLGHHWTNVKKKKKSTSHLLELYLIFLLISFLCCYKELFFFIKVASHLWFYRSTRQEAAYCQPYKYVHTSQYNMYLKKNKTMHFVTGALSRCAASSPCAGFPAKGSVPVFEELLEDDGLLSLWQDFHL